MWVSRKEERESERLKGLMHCDRIGVDLHPSNKQNEYA